MAYEYYCNDRRGKVISVTFLGLTLFVVFLAFFVFNATSNDANTTKIQFAAVVFRHGERSPSGSYSTDPNKNHTWPGGYGALSPRGSLQAYKLGMGLRKRYTHLIPTDGLYANSYLNVMSSEAERCLMTAQSFSAGFLPPVDNLNILPIQWQPVAVTSIPRSQDRILAQKADCAKYDELLKKMYVDPPPELKLFVEQNAALFEYISQHTGENITTLDKAEQLYNILSIQKEVGLMLPDWTEKVYPAKLLALAERNLAVLTETDYMKRIKGGSFITDVYEKMMRKKTKTLNPDRTLFIYSGHDVTLVNVMRTLNIIDQTSKKPDFASAIYFELHQNDALEDDLEVKIFYRFKGDNDETRQIVIPDCDPEPCSLTNFGKSINKIIINDYEKSCKKDESDI